ncbi:MAG: hypothetical protein ACTSXL_03460 [Alphaproteobacteria bacterium]|nr:MAG: hypothetical protein B6I23_00035 [Rickettsiaceae bacterium 4572_127]
MLNKFIENYFFKGVFVLMFLLIIAGIYSIGNPETRRKYNFEEAKRSRISDLIHCVQKIYKEDKNVSLTDIKKSDNWSCKNSDMEKNNLHYKVLSNKKFQVCSDISMTLEEIRDFEKRTGIRDKLEIDTENKNCKEAYFIRGN